MTENTLPDRLVSAAENGCPTLMLTVDKCGFAHSAYAYVLARGSDHLHFVVENETQSYKNLLRTRQVSFHIMAPDDCLFLVKGSAECRNPHIDDIPINAAHWVADVIAAKSQSWPNVAVSALQYEWSDSCRSEMLAMESRLFRELASG